MVKLFLIIAVLGVVYKVKGDVRVPILTAPLGNFPVIAVNGCLNATDEYFKKVTFYEIWQISPYRGGSLTPFEIIVESTVFIMYLEAYILQYRGLLTEEILGIRKIYNCPDLCYEVKDVDLLNAAIDQDNSTNIDRRTMREVHQLAVKAMEQKFHFNMKSLEQKLQLSSLEVTNDRWADFVPEIVSAAINFRANILNVTASDLAELLNTNISVLLGYNINQIENIFFPEFDDLVVRKNLFDIQTFSLTIAGMNSSEWQSQTMAHYANKISNFSVRHLEILYKWGTAQLFAIDKIPISTYFSECNSAMIFSPLYSAFNLSKAIFGHENVHPSCSVAYILSRSLKEDEFRFNLATITDRNILDIIRNASGISSWFDFYKLLFAISEGITMEIPRISQVQSHIDTPVNTLSVPQIAHIIRNLNGSGDLRLITDANHREYLLLLLQTYAFSASGLANVTGRTVAEIDNLSIQGIHNLIFEALHKRYNISEFLSKLDVAGVDKHVAINLPSFEWHRLTRAAIESSFVQLASAFSTNLTYEIGGVSVLSLEDGTSSIQIKPGSQSSNFIVSISRLASCLGTTLSEVHKRNMSGYLYLYQDAVVDLMEKKITLETVTFNDVLAQFGITLDSIKDTETVGGTIQSRIGLTAEQLQCMYGWSSKFIKFTHSTTWANVSLFHESGDYTSWSLYQNAAESEMCFVGPCSVNADCTNTVGSYLCTCHHGFEGNGSICQDIDECKLGTHNCSVNASCGNINGAYTCECKTGFLGDGFVCTDINECDSSLHDCHLYANCSNSIGSFSCYCMTGFFGNGTSCKDTDECLLQNNGCSPNASCTNTFGSYTCQCKPGYMGNGITCPDIDECNGFPDCHIYSNCVNTPGSFFCSCNAGFSGNGTFCQDIDECAGKLDQCNVSANCTNTNGSYNCTCQHGYTGDGFVCADIDECTTDLHDCRNYAICINNKGSYHCSCKSGYSGDGTFCQDIDECERSIHTCDVNAMCSNTNGSFTCNCNAGYEGNGTSCIDINECASSLHDCRNNAICVNNNGSFLCSCRTGYSGNGTFCEDINECVTDLHDCHNYAKCVNNEGSYNCSCDSGYSGNGTFCEDAKECLANPCSPFGTCKETSGSFTCTCNNGYSGDGLSCSGIVTGVYIWKTDLSPKSVINVD